MIGTHHVVVVLEETIYAQYYYCAVLIVLTSVYPLPKAIIYVIVGGQRGAKSIKLLLAILCLSLYLFIERHFSNIFTVTSHQ